MSWYILVHAGTDVDLLVLVLAGADVDVLVPEVDEAYITRKLMIEKTISQTPCCCASLTSSLGELTGCRCMGQWVGALHWWGSQNQIEVQMNECTICRQISQNSFCGTKSDIESAVLLAHPSSWIADAPIDTPRMWWCILVVVICLLHLHQIVVQIWMQNISSHHL